MYAKIKSRGTKNTQFYVSIPKSLIDSLEFEVDDLVSIKSVNEIEESEFKNLIGLPVSYLDGVQINNFTAVVDRRNRIKSFIHNSELEAYPYRYLTVNALAVRNVSDFS